MIVGVGVDLIEIERVKAALEKGRFAQRVFSEDEQVYCESRGAQRFASYAARFAGKEAVLKAFGTGLSGGKWLDIEILPDALGRPTVRLSGYYAELALSKRVSAIHISLAHARENAVAQVVIWGGAAE
jgi:holo-[acyl-carrier protein] synthase